MNPILFEPFKIKVVEPIYMSTPQERAGWLEEAGHNMFNLKAEQVMIDMLTDSGTGAMSDRQWAAIMGGDESYAGSRSYVDLEETACDIFDKRFILPVHQGRAAEHLLFSLLVKPGDRVPSNGHFDTTGANIDDNGGEPVNLPVAEARDPFLEAPFKGNMDVEKLREFLTENGEKVPFVMLTVTNNTGGGQPVSLENIEQVAAVCRDFNKKLVMDGCRWAENAYFIKLREPGYAEWSVREIARKMFSPAFAVTFSGKKDALANIGGLLCVEDEQLAEDARNRMIVTEGFPTYGGLSGRDMAAMAQGLREVQDESYLKYRLRTIEWIVERLAAGGVPVLRPAGGHAFYIDAAKFFPHIPAREFPGIALTNEMYLRAGVRAVELGNVAFGRRDAEGKEIFPPLDLVRFAMPRRVYTEAHMGYVVESLLALHKEASNITGWKFVKEAPVMRHFRSTFTPVGAKKAASPAA